MRSRAGELGIDPERIAAGGGSAGGHLAGTLATLNEINDPADDAKVSTKPACLVLFNPALSLDFERAESVANTNRERLLSVSPYHHLEPGANSRLDELQAAILHARLAHLGAWTARRREIAAALERLAPTATAAEQTADAPGDGPQKFVVALAEFIVGVELVVERIGASSGPFRAVVHQIVQRVVFIAFHDGFLLLLRCGREQARKSVCPRAAGSSVRRVREAHSGVLCRG
mgnify:CR=1 FL=1